MVQKLKKMYMNDYNDFLLDINNFADLNSKEFYRCLNNLVNFRKKGKVVSNVKVGEVRDRDESLEILNNYYGKLFDSVTDLQHFESMNDFEDVEVDVMRGLNRVAYGKAVGIDHIPGEWYKKDLPKIFTRLKDTFDG
jgi:hypothetical protein